MKLCPKCNKQFSDDANFCPVDAARLHPIAGSDPESDSLTARFTLGEKLGGGRTGPVFRATDRQASAGSPATVAVKIVDPAVVALPGVGPKLERELKQLERVPSVGVAKVFASGKRGDDFWVAMELLDGAQTLADAITARGPISLDEAAHLIEVIGEALIEAAQVGVVHRDLAPKNVLFAGQDIKLVNFSLPVPSSAKVPGVPEFVAPEQVDGKPVDQRSNLYSLGALYYYVLTGQPVHTGSPDEVHRAHVNGSIKTPSSLAPVPGPVEALILRALDRSPTKRFLTVRQFVDEVSRIARGQGGQVKGRVANEKSGRVKGDLVQTLLGVARSGATVTPAAAAPIAAAAPNPQTTLAGIPSGPSHLTAPPMVSPVAVATTLPAPAPASLPSIASAPTLAPERSPWSPPAPGPMAAAQAAVAAAAPEIAKVTLPPPTVPSAPVVAAPPVAKKNAAGGEAKGKFRETMWFKKGELDAQAAQAAAEEAARTGKDSTDRADSLPIDERYKDDGTITRGDKEKYSLRTGATQMMKAMTDAGASDVGRVSEDALISEMKGGRQWVLLAIAGGIALIILIVVLAAR